MKACRSQNMEIVKLLLNHNNADVNIDVNKRNKKGHSAFTIALNNGFYEACKLIINTKNYVCNQTDLSIMHKSIVLPCLLIFAEETRYLVSITNIGRNNEIKRKLINADDNMVDNLVQSMSIITMYGSLTKKIALCQVNVCAKPGNYIALCDEISFALDFENKDVLYSKLNPKLKFLFDIRSADDMMKKIKYYSDNQ